MGIVGILAQVVGSGTAGDQPFDQVAQSVPSDVLAKGLAGAFRAEETPAIGEMVGQLFGSSNGQQQAGMLNQILATLGPAAAASLAGGVLGRVMSPGSSQITPDQASQLSPQQAQEVVEHVHQTNPGIADELASFYAQHSGLIKTLGGAALAIAIAKMKDHLSQSLAAGATVRVQSVLGMRGRSECITRRAVMGLDFRLVFQKTPRGGFDASMPGYYGDQGPSNGEQL